jgi:hypothetical protein
VAAVAAQIPIAEVPELPACAVSDERRPDEDIRVVVRGGIVLIEVAEIVAPGIRAAHEGVAAAPFRFDGRFVILRVRTVELGDHVARAARDLR